jgi:tRNA (cmo5U34)-methyltransferase
MTDKKNIVGDEIKSERGNWSFKSGVAKTFDSHVERSVPLYQEGHDLILDITDYFIKENSTIYDLGCSTGELLTKLHQHHSHKNNLKYYGLDYSDEMIREAKTRTKEKNIFLESKDITKVKPKNNSLTILYYTLQFINPSVRQDVINNIYNSLEWGGALILFEKVRASDARFQDILSTTYDEYKIRNNFTMEEISSKTRSLRGQLEPFSTQGNIDMMKRAGFVDINSILKYICFEGFIAIK